MAKTRHTKPMAPSKLRLRMAMSAIFLVSNPARRGTAVG